MHFLLMLLLATPLAQDSTTTIAIAASVEAVINHRQTGRAPAPLVTNPVGDTPKAANGGTALLLLDTLSFSQVANVLGATSVVSRDVGARLNTRLSRFQTQLTDYQSVKVCDPACGLPDDNSRMITILSARRAGDTLLVRVKVGNNVYLYLDGVKMPDSRGMESPVYAVTLLPDSGGFRATAVVQCTTRAVQDACRVP